MKVILKEGVSILDNLFTTLIQLKRETFWCNRKGRILIYVGHSEMDALRSCRSIYPYAYDLIYNNSIFGCPLYVVNEEEHGIKIFFEEEL